MFEMLVMAAFHPKQTPPARRRRTDKAVLQGPVRAIPLTRTGGCEGDKLEEVEDPPIPSSRDAVSLDGLTRADART